MPATPTSVTRFLRAATAAVAFAALSACAAQPPAAAGGAAPAAPGPAAFAAGPQADLTRPVPLALLAPLSSPEPRAQAQARDLEAAARLAAAQLGTAVELRVLDDGGDPSRARAAAASAVEGGAKMILGPLFSAQTKEIRAVAEAAGVPVLSFSSDLTAGGAPVWVLGDLPENEVDRVMGFAAARGMRSVAVVRPQNDYGALVEAAARAKAPRMNVALVGALAYPRSAEGVQDAVGRGAAQVKAAAPRAVLIADGGPALRLVGAYLANGDVIQPQTQYLGLGLWDDDPDVARESALQGGWFAAADPAQGQAFAARFQAETGRAPGPLAAFAYDAVMAAGALIRDARAAGTDRPFAVDAITRPQGFPGARGAFRLRADGGNDRALAVFEVAPAGFLVRDPAPAAFAPGV
jgi:ABC-type branched-subunit amino acid transport system substrate-binding protein